MEFNGLQGHTRGNGRTSWKKVGHSGELASPTDFCFLLAVELELRGFLLEFLREETNSSPLIIDIGEAIRESRRVGRLFVPEAAAKQSAFRFALPFANGEQRGVPTT